MAKIYKVTCSLEVSIPVQAVDEIEIKKIIEKYRDDIFYTEYSIKNIKEIRSLKQFEKEFPDWSRKSAPYSLTEYTSVDKLLPEEK